jgi:hypothetical protein
MIYLGMSICNLLDITFHSARETAVPLNICLRPGSFRRGDQKYQENVARMPFRPGVRLTVEHTGPLDGNLDQLFVQHHKAPNNELQQFTTNSWKSESTSCNLHSLGVGPLEPKVEKTLDVKLIPFPFTCVTSPRKIVT